MNYSLSIDLLGGEKVEAILNKLASMSGSIGGGTSKMHSVMGDAVKSFANLNRESEKYERNLNGILNFSNKYFKSSFLGFGSGLSPKVSIASSAIPGYKGITGNPLQAAMEAAGSGSLASNSESASRFIESKSRAQRIREMKARDRYERMIESSKRKDEKDLVTFRKDMSFLLMPLFNPGSMWATLFSARQTYSALNTEHGKNLLSKMGGMGAGMGTLTLVGAATAAGFALMGLKKTIDGVISAYSKGSQLYGKALSSGMGLGFTTKVSTLASIMGVSEQDVFRFGNQLKYLNPKLKDAQKILQETSQPLTQVDWQWKIMKLDLSAMFAKLASDAAPAMTKFITNLDVLIKFLTKSSDVIGETLSRIMKSSPLYWFYRGTQWEANKLYGVTQSQVDKAYAPGKMPGPNAWMHQLPSSHWEKMGLVTMGGSSNYLRDIAKSTKETASALKQLVIKGGQTWQKWNMSPNTNNP